MNGSSTGRTHRVRVALVDDDEIVVEGLAQMLAPYRDRIDVVTTALVREDAAAQAIQAEADVVLLDVRHRGLTGNDLVVEMLADAPPFRLVVFTHAPADGHIREALRLGASGYLLKSISGADLADRLVRAHRGEVVMDPTVASEAVRRAGFRPEPGWPGQEIGLTERESEVLGLLAKGLTNPQIASDLEIGDETVKTYLRRLYAKLGANNRAGAVDIARRQGIV